MPYCEVRQPASSHVRASQTTTTKIANFTLQTMVKHATAFRQHEVGIAYVIASAVDQPDERVVGEIRRCDAWVLAQKH